MKPRTWSSASSDQSGGNLVSDTPGNSEDHQPHASSQLHDAECDTEAIQAWAWFSNTFCVDGKYRQESGTSVVPWKDFWDKLRDLARSKGLNEVAWSFVDHGLSQAAQQDVFKDHLWLHVRPLKRTSITSAEFKAAVVAFSPASGSMADLIESIMLDAPGSRANPTLTLRDQAFISHTGSDEEKCCSVGLTTALFHELWDNKQLLAFYDTHALDTGCKWRDKIAHCVRSSKVVVVVLSPGYFSRYWCMHELDLALNAEPQPGRRVIIPVLLGVSREWSKKVATYRQAWQELSQVSSLPAAQQTRLLDRWEANLKKLDDLQAPEAERVGKDWEHKRVLPLVVPKVQQQIASVLSLQQWGSTQRLSSVHIALPEHNIQNDIAFSHLATSIETACKHQVEAIKKTAGAGASGQASGSTGGCLPSVVQLQGLAGMGKSVLGLQLAQHYEDTVGCFSGSVHFLRVPSQDPNLALNTAVMQLQRELLHQLQPAIEVSSNAVSPDALHLEIDRAFASVPLHRLTHLLVLDGVWDKAFIEQMLCKTMRGVILVTSRESVWDTAGSIFSLQPDNSHKAASDLMMKVLGEKHKDITKDQQATIKHVLEKCDGNMFATDLMAAVLRDREPSSWQTLSDQFADRVGESKRPLNSAIQTTLDALAAAGMDGRAALQTFDMLRHVESRLLLPMPLLQLLWSTLHPARPADEVSFLLRRLWRASLVCQTEDSTYYTHAVVADFLAKQSPTTNLPGAGLFGWVSGYRLPRKRASVSSGVAGVAALLQWVGSWRPWQLPAKVATPAFMKLAVLLLGYGRPHAVKWAQQLFGVKPVDAVAVSYLGYLPDWAREESEAPFAWEAEGRLCSRVGILLRNSGCYKQAEPWLREALAIRRRELTPNHPDVAASLNNLALLLQDLGKLDEAELKFNEALEIWEEIRGLEHKETAVTLNNLAWLLRRMNRLTDAESRYKEALRIRQKVMGPEHSETASSLNDLALLLQAQGNLRDAEPMFSKALAIREKVFGLEHPDTITTANNLAKLRAEADAL